MIIETPACTGCDQTSLVEVDENQYNKWQTGTFIQDAFPNSTPEFREMLMTGTHGQCWDEMFKDLEDEGEVPF